jgi:hypothetical protein
MSGNRGRLGLAAVDSFDKSLVSPRMAFPSEQQQHHHQHPLDMQSSPPPPPPPPPPPQSIERKSSSRVPLSLPEWIGATKASTTKESTEAVSQSSATTSTSTTCSCSTTTATTKVTTSTPSKNKSSEDDIYTRLEETTDQIVACQATKNVLQVRLGVIQKNLLVVAVSIGQDTAKQQNHRGPNNDTSIIHNNNKNNNKNNNNNKSNNHDDNPKVLSWNFEQNSIQQELKAVELEISNHAQTLLDLHEELLDLEESNMLD